MLTYLQCCDYGILVREQSETNRVASPTKFAEYLYAGLKVLVSKNLGDFSEFVLEHDCGYVVNNSFNESKFEKVNVVDRNKCFELANLYFKKESSLNEVSYKKIIKAVLET